MAHTPFGKSAAKAAMRLCSSMVATRRYLAKIRIRRLSSIGLIVGMLITPTEKPHWRMTSAAAQDAA
jgi:hypothetical protein